jgi:DNA-binding XRE family transcriptional regulator
MGQDQSQAGQKLDTDGERTSEHVQEEIERTRAEMGETVAALAEKTDVKRQAHKALDSAKVTASGTGARIKEIVSTHRLAVAAGAGVLATAALLARRGS